MVWSSCDFIAVRRGNGNIKNCIFLRWIDCASFLSNDLAGEIEYSSFDSIHDAVAYIASPDPLVLHSPPTDSPPVEISPTSAGPVKENSVSQSISMPQFSKLSKGGEQMISTPRDVNDQTTTPNVNKLERTSARKRKRSLEVQTTESAWENMFSRLKSFKEENNNVDVPVDNAAYKDLYRWIAEQREAYRKLKEGFKNVGGFSDEKAERLLGLGFDFEYFSWESRYLQLKVIILSHDFGTSSFDKDLSERDPALYRWWAQQKILHRAHSSGKQTTLTRCQVLELERLGVSITEPINDDFERMFEELLRYKKSHGHCNVSSSDNAPLASWVLKQRTQYRKLREGKSSHLTAHDMARLTDVGFIFCLKAKTPSWDERICSLREKFHRDGHIRYPKSDNGIRSWICRQRKEYQAFQDGRKSQLTQNMIDQLNELGMIWVTGFAAGTAHASPRKTWDTRFEDLKDFVQQYGHCIVPQLTPGLGEWVHTQRVEYKKMQKGETSSMTAERALKLLEVGFCFDATKQRGKAADLKSYAEYAISRRTVHDI